MVKKNKEKLIKSLRSNLIRRKKAKENQQIMTKNLKKNDVKISVVGATGMVGRELLKILSEKKFQISNITALASDDSEGKEVSFGSTQTMIVKNLNNHDFSKDDISFFVAGSGISHNIARKVASSGCIVIDNSSYFRNDDEIPLIIPEVNPDAVSDYKKHNIIANPNCSTIQILVAVKPLHDLAEIKKIIVSTYQSTSGAGKAAMDELYEHTKQRFAFSDLKSQNFERPITFNCIPKIGEVDKNGFTSEENKMILETQKILQDDNIKIYPTCVRVPVFVGHAESITLEFEDKLILDEVYEALSDAEGVIFSRSDYKTQTEIVGYNDVFISRLRLNPENSLSMWCVTDNIRKGAALNAVQIAELLFN